MSKPQLPVPELEESILSLYSRQRMGIKRICKILNTDSQSILQVLKKHNVRIRGCDSSPTSGPRHAYKLTAALYQSLLAELKEGKRHAPLGRKYGISRERVRQIATIEGTPSGRELQTKEAASRNSHKRQTRTLAMQARRQAFLDRLETMSRLWKAGKTVEQIGKAVGLSPASVSVRICNLRDHYPQHFPYRYQQWKIRAATDNGVEEVLKSIVTVEDMSQP